MGAPPELELPEPPSRLGTGEPKEIALTAIYWDTADLRLTRNGMSLRHRIASDGSERGWTLKLPIPSDNRELMSRTEVHFPGRAARPPLAATRLVVAVTLGADLETVAEIITTRRQFDLLDGDEIRARVMDDHVRATPRTGRPLAFREIEIEVVGSDMDAAKRYVRRLRKAGADRLAVQSKIEQVLKLTTPEPSLATEECNVEDLVRSIFVDALNELRHADPLIRLGEGTEPVHQARVATRRLRSNLHIVASMLDPQWVAAADTELRWLGEVLGAVRDVDVLGLRFSEELARPRRSSTSVPTGAEQFLAIMKDERATVGRRLIKALGSARYLELLGRLEQAATKPPLADGVDNRQPALPVVGDNAHVAWRRLSKAVNRVDAQSSGIDLHRVRRRAKHVRYSAQLAAPLAGKKAAQLASALGDLQDSLSELQDAAVAEQWLKRVVPSDASPSLRRTAEKLRAIKNTCGDQHRDAWRAVWKQARKPKLRTWM